MCDRATELLRQLRDSERNLLKDNLALRKNAMDLVNFDGNHNVVVMLLALRLKEVDEFVVLKEK